MNKITILNNYTQIRVVYPLLGKWDTAVAADSITLFYASAYTSCWPVVIFTLQRIILIS